MSTKEVDCELRLNRLSRLGIIAMACWAWTPLAQDASSQEVLPQAAQATVAHDLRATTAEQVMGAVDRLFSVPAAEWNSNVRQAVSDAIVDEMMRRGDQKALDDIHQFMALSELVLDIAFEGDPVVIPALVLFPVGGTYITRALHELGDPAFRAVLDMVSSVARPVDFAVHRAQGVTSSMYSGGLDVLAAFVYYDGVNAFDRETQAELRAVALRTLEAAVTWMSLDAGIGLAAALGDPETMAAVERLTDKDALRARGIADPWAISRIAEDAQDAMAGRRRAPYPPPLRQPTEGRS